MAVEIGDSAPAFRRTSDSGETVSLDDYRGKQLVIYFYPKAFTPGCTTESCDFRDRHDVFAAAGYDIVGVSPDEPDRLADFRAEHDLPFPMLSDPDHAMAETYGAWGVKKNYGREYEGLIRSTFVIDGDGVVAKAWRNVRAKGHVERVVNDLV